MVGFPQERIIWKLCCIRLSAQSIQYGSHTNTTTPTRLPVSPLLSSFPVNGAAVTLCRLWMADKSHMEIKNATCLKSNRSKSWWWRKKMLKYFDCGDKCEDKLHFLFKSLPPVLKRLKENLMIMFKNSTDKLWRRRNLTIEYYYDPVNMVSEITDCEQFTLLT